MPNKSRLSLCQKYFEDHPSVDSLLNDIISQANSPASAEQIVNDIMNPMVSEIYSELSDAIRPEELTAEEAKFFVGEMSVFARYNSTLLLRAADAVRPFCPELAQEFMRNYLEEGGERGKLPAHYVIFSGALIKDLGFRVNGWTPRCPSTHKLFSLIDMLAWSHCPSTILGMYYATEAVAIDETRLLNKITNRIGELEMGRQGEDLPNLDFYYRMHLDDEHEAATAGVAVEQGHQEGIAHFIVNADTYGFLVPQIVDGFLQMFTPFAEQWEEINVHLRS
jgi:hypothetical protein